MNLHACLHVPFEGLGTIAAWAAARGHRVTATRFHAGDPLPRLDALDWLVVMGGPMSVWEESAHPWLPAEKRLIEGAVGAGKSVLGVCLGAQLLAEVLGARVYANRYREIGWHPVRRCEAGPGSAPVLGALPPVMQAFHWHGDTFDLPAGAQRIARSDACDNQGFVWGERVVGLQFHLEVTRGGVEALIDHARADLAEGPFVQTPEAMLADEQRFLALPPVIMALLDRLEASAS